MIKYVPLEIKSLESYDAIEKHIPSELYDSRVIDSLKENIGTKCDRIVIEYPYYDSDYLSTYYGHYSQKFRKYVKECCRLHLEHGEQYYGYITLRPTIGTTKIGKSYLDPRLFVKDKAYLMCSEFTAHVHGQDMNVKCFPWKKQQTDVTCCAHTATWTILRYYGNKYKNYSDTTIGSLVEKVKDNSGRKTPTKGLTPIQVSELFKTYEFSPLIIDNSKEGNLFLEEIISYIESGIPMVGFIAPEKHAISIIGHGKVNYNTLNDTDLFRDSRIVSHACLISSVYVMDDRYFPYREVPSLLPDQNSDVHYSLSQIRYVVIPLYKRMQLVYRDVYEKLQQWLEENRMKWEKKCIYRIYITSSNSLKRITMSSSEEPQMPQELKEIIIKTSLPRFVWCVDLAGTENYRNNLTSGRIIIDSTSASLEPDPWIIRHDSEKIEFKDYDTDANVIQTKKCRINPYKMYINNLDNIDGIYNQG